MERHTIAFHPSRGPAGSMFRDTAGTVYARTPFGIRRLDPAVGTSLFYAYQQRKTILGLGMILSGLVGLCIGVFL